MAKQAKATPGSGFEPVAVYKSTRTPGIQYTLKRKDGDNGQLYCNCPGWQFSKDKPRACRHTRRWLEIDHLSYTGPVDVPVESITRRVLRDKKVIGLFNAEQLVVLEKCFEARLENASYGAASGLRGFGGGVPGPVGKGQIARPVRVITLD